MADDGDKKGAEEEKPKGNLLGLLFFLFNLMVMGGGAFLVYQETIALEPKKMQEEIALEELIKEREERSKTSALYALERLSVNLAGKPHKKLTVEMHLEMLSENGFEEIVLKSAEARDYVYRILNKKTFKDLESIQGKLFLKDQIATVLNSRLRNGVVKDVFFTEFRIQ